MYGTTWHSSLAMKSCSRFTFIWQSNSSSLTLKGMMTNIKKKWDYGSEIILSNQPTYSCCCSTEYRDTINIGEKVRAAVAAAALTYRKYWCLTRTNTSVWKQFLTGSRGLSLEDVKTEDILLSTVYTSCFLVIAETIFATDESEITVYASLIQLGANTARRGEVCHLLSPSSASLPPMWEGRTVRRKRRLLIDYCQTGGGVVGAEPEAQRSHGV